MISSLLCKLLSSKIFQREKTPTEPRSCLCRAWSLRSRGSTLRGSSFGTRTFPRTSGGDLGLGFIFPS